MVTLMILERKATMSRYGRTKEEIKNIFKVDVDKVHFEDRGNYKISPVLDVNGFGNWVHIVQDYEGYTVVNTDTNSTRSWVCDLSPLEGMDFVKSWALHSKYQDEHWGE